jgi:hypothetical protein
MAVSFTILVTWVFIHTKGNLVLASLLHLTLNISVNLVESRGFYLQAIIFLVFALGIVFIAGKSLTKTSRLPFEQKPIMGT